MDFVLCGPTSLTISSCIKAQLHCSMDTDMNGALCLELMTCVLLPMSWKAVNMDQKQQHHQNCRRDGGRLVETVWGRPPKPNMKYNFERWGKIVTLQAARLLRCQVWDIAGPPWKSPSLICSKQVGMWADQSASGGGNAYWWQNQKLPQACKWWRSWRGCCNVGGFIKLLCDTGLQNSIFFMPSWL